MNLLTWVKDLFVPHSRNNHRAKILHPASLAIVVAFLLVSQFGLNFFTLVSPSVLGFASNITPERVIELTNQRRMQNGLKPLKDSEVLNEVARRKAADMFAFNYWAHVSPSGRTPWSFFKEAGYKYIYAGENLARDFNNSSAVVDAWMNSPTHKENILNSHYKEIGLAVVNGTLDGVKTTLVVQVFGTPTPAIARSEAPVKPRLGEAKAASEKQLVLMKSLPAKVVFSPFSLTKAMVIFLLGLILGALVVDGLLTHRRRVVRLSGKNLAHALFVGTFLLAIVLTGAGAIL